MAVNVYDAITELSNDGFRDMVFYCGEDRYESFLKLKQYVDEKAELNSFEVKTIARSDEDVSASKARQAAIDNDWKSFCDFSASKDEEINKNIFVELRNMMGVE